MPMIIPIQSIPNQSFSISLDNISFEISIKTTNGVTSMTISADGVTICENTRAVAGYPVIPYQYLEQGNFLFFTANFEMPFYTQFNITQFLYYYSKAELMALRVDSEYPVTESDFNPISDLPLRFKPIGYTAA